MFGFIVYIITNLISFYIRNKFQIQSINPHTPINKTDKWVERIVLILMIICLICTFMYDDYFDLLGLSIIALIVFSNGFDTYMEYKHQKKQREYLLKSVSFLGSIVLFLGALYFLYHTSTLEEVFVKYGNLDYEKISELEIIKRKEDALDSEKAIITDKQTMEQIFSEMEKVEVRNWIGEVEEDNNEYHLLMGQGGLFFIEIYEEFISVDFDYYKVTGENNIYNLLEESNLDWKSEE